MERSGKAPDFTQHRATSGIREIWRFLTRRSTRQSVTLRTVTRGQIEG